MVRFLSTLLLLGASTVALANEPTPALPPAGPRTVIVEPVSEKAPAPVAAEAAAATEALHPCKCVTKCRKCEPTCKSACNTCERPCERDCHPVLNFVKRELVDKPAYGVKLALTAAEERRCEKAECHLAKKACHCGNCDCCKSKLACESEKLECRKANVAAKRAELNEKFCELYGNK